jgi:hypothetical protein
MPKEVVWSYRDIFGEKEPFRVEVGWSRESGDVQIVTADPSKPEVGEPCRGFYVDLDRKGINDLIRNLRRARDQAFGRDE